MHFVASALDQTLKAGLAAILSKSFTVQIRQGWIYSRTQIVLVGIVTSLLILPCQRSLFAQAGLRESLERLDRNANGSIEPSEITPLARPYLARIGEKSRLDLSRPHEVSAYQEAARVYYAMRTGLAGTQIEVESKSTLKNFKADPSEPLVPDFGLPAVKYPYAQVDLDEADQTLRRYDENRDGVIDREEAADARWTHDDPFDMDLDQNDRLTRMEFAQRYARRRLLSGSAEELRKKAKVIGSGVKPSPARENPREESRWWRDGGSSQWLTGSVMGRFDLNRDGRLQAAETQTMGISMGSLDIDRNGELSREELHAYLKAEQDEAGDEALGLPGWFFELDKDEDRQVSMAEFTQEWTNDKLSEFALLDSNDDGLLTANEAAQSKALVGGKYSNDEAEVLPPKKTIISEIEIDEDFIIGELRLQLSITHNSTSLLDAILTGPEGQRVELFTEVGGSGDHFDQTIFDDRSGNPIAKAAAPFQGSFMTTSLLKGQPSLSQFIGKQARGTWQLVVRGTRSDRFGMLHNWSLLMKPKERDLTP